MDIKTTRTVKFEGEVGSLKLLAGSDKRIRVSKATQVMYFSFEELLAVAEFVNQVERELNGI